MNNKGFLSVEIAIVIIIIVLVIGVLTILTSETNEKIRTSISSETNEKIAAETCENLINNPGIPLTWNKLENPNNITPGLAIIDENNKTIPNSVSFNKFLKLNEFYKNLIDYKVFNDEIKSSIILEPLESSISSVTIGDKIDSGNIYVETRQVICDFYSEYVLKDFKGNNNCNHDHGTSYSCNYFKIFPSNLENFDYYLLINEDEYKGLKYTIDTTKNKSEDFKIATKDVIYLNSILEEKINGENSSIIFIHFKEKNVNAVIIQVPKEFDKKIIKYDYFQKTKCKFSLIISY